MNNNTKHLGLDWTAILANAGIAEPPGRNETIEALKAVKAQQSIISRRKGTMSYIARCHPLCGWLRLQPQDYARTMQELLKQRDDYLLIKPDHSGPAPGYMQWVWDVGVATISK
jgi:hypothetical protein